jgi:hypothetical protein
MGKKSRRTKDPWLREACEQWYRLRVASATTNSRGALTMLHFVAIIMYIMYLLPGSLATCFARVCDCILHGAARKSIVQATEEAGTKVHIKGLSKEIQFNGRIGHVTGTTVDGRVAVKILGGKMLAVKMEHLELVQEDSSTGSASNQGASDLPEDSIRSKEGIGICPNLAAAVVEAANFSVYHAAFCVAATPLLLTRMSVQCCKAMIRAGIRSPLFPLIAIAATKSAMCEAVAAKSPSNADTETMLYAHTSHFSGLCSSTKCPTLIGHLLLWRLLMAVPTTVIVMVLAVPCKFARVDEVEVSNSYSNQCVDVNHWLDDTLEESDKVTTKSARGACISGCVDDVDGGRHLDKGSGIDLADAERKAGKSAFDFAEEETQDVNSQARVDGLFAAQTFDPFELTPPSLQMQGSAVSKSNFECKIKRRPREVTPVRKDHSKEEAQELQSNQRIFLKPPEGGPITISFYPSKTVSEVKQDIKHRLGLDPSDYSLYINAWCKRLDRDNLSLSDYGIGKDSTLVINYASLQGGAGRKRGRQPKDEEKGAMSDAERKRKSREKRTPQQVEADKAGNTSKRRETRGAGRKRGRPPKEGAMRPSAAGRKRTSREKRTPQQVETENGKRKEFMGGLRRARKATVVNQAGSFDGTKLWEVPDRDYLFTDFQNDPELSVLLWYANNGSWRNREPWMLFAFLRLLDKLRCSSDDDEDSEDKLCNLIALCQESIEDKASLLRVVHERIKESDWGLISDWQQEKGINNSELAALEWLVTKPLDCGEECKQLREKRQQRAPILDSWARSLIGLQLKVPGWWWQGPRCKSDRKKYNCEIVNVEYKDEEKRYFWIHCEEDNHTYPMAYVDVKKHSRWVKQKSGRRFDLPVEAYSGIDENLEKLCADTLKALEASSHENLVKEYRNFIIKRVEQIVDSQRVTPEKQRELGRKFLKAQGRGVSWGEATQGNEGDLTSVDAPLLTCASCGFRARHHGEEKDEKSLFKDKAVKLLHWAELDDEKRSEHLEKMAKPPLCLPINDKGGRDDFKNFEPWRAYSRWPPRKPDELAKDTTLPDWMFYKNDNGELDRSKPKYFHLHPEFVEEFTDVDGRKDFKVRLCPNCCEFTPSEKSKAPMRSIARGVDFGSPVRVGLVRLTPRERQMISKVRHYNNATKIESNTGRQREHSHSAIKGHSILFDHDSPRVIRDLLSEKNINDSIDLHFVGPDGQYDHLARIALGSAHVSARPFAVYQWLSVLAEVNEMYSEDGELEEFPIVAKRIHKCNKALVENAKIVTVDKHTAKEADVTRDDIREVRVSSSRGEPAGSINEVSVLLKRAAALYRRVGNDC